jgi:hypothetical protein
MVMAKKSFPAIEIQAPVMQEEIIAAVPETEFVVADRPVKEIEESKSELLNSKTSYRDKRMRLPLNDIIQRSKSYTETGYSIAYWQS